MWPSPCNINSIMLFEAQLEDKEEDEAKEARLQTQRKLANKLIDRLRSSNLVISRPLPKRAGNAIVLSTAGARHLQRSLNIHVHPGDKWGRSTDGRWHAPTAWEHELLVTLVMLDFLSLGDEVKTEHEIRAENPGLHKYPDGLAKYTVCTDNKFVEEVAWIEVESADKSGAKMLALTKSLTKVQRGMAPVLSGWKPSMSLVAYRGDMLDLSGKPIDHKNRIVSAIRRHIGADLSLNFQKVQLKDSSYHVRSLWTEHVTVYPLDLNDPKIKFSTSAFHSNKHGTFVNHSVDKTGHEWTIKVYKYADRFRWEIWDSPEPHSQLEQPRDAFLIEDLEQAFRIALNRWRTKFY